MVRLKSRREACIDGFQFIDAAISDQVMKNWDFETLAREIQSRRAGNPRFNLTTDLNSIRQEVDQQNALRMLHIRNAESYIVTEPGPLPNRAALRSPSWQGAVGGAKKVVAGMGVLKDWLGAGGVPVAKEKSDSRAGVCAVCPQNQPGNLLSIFTQPVAERIKAQIAMKHDMNLSTTHDAKLNVCQACWCPLELKVHTPLEHIVEHLSDEVKAKLDPACWILKEQARLATTI